MELRSDSGETSGPPCGPATPRAGHGATTTGARRYATPTGEPCPRTVHVDGTVEGTGECLWCGFCLLIADAPWCAAPRGGPG